MAVLSPSSWTQYGSYDARNDRLHVTGLLSGSGATGSTSFAVTQTTIPSMNVVVGPGTAYIDSNWGVTQGYYCFVNDAPINVPVQPADSTNPRIDRVIARVYDAFYAGTENKSQIEVIKGEPAVSPSVPPLPNSSIELARITVSAGASSIVTGSINNTVMPLTSLRNSLVQQALNVAWTSYTPTFTNITAGGGANTGRYQIIGKTVHVVGSWTFGAGAAVGANPTMNLPVPSISYGPAQPLGVLGLLDSGTTYNIGWARWSSTTAAQILGSSGAGIASTFPWTWTTSDTISWNLTYETV